MMNKQQMMSRKIKISKKDQRRIPGGYCGTSTMGFWYNVSG